MSHVFDFKSIKQILDRQEQKADFEEKNPEPEQVPYMWPYGVAATGAVPTTTYDVLLKQIEEFVGDMKPEQESALAAAYSYLYNFKI